MANDLFSIFNKKKKSHEPVPVTSQQSIPYLGVYENGVIEVAEGYFSKSYLLEDVNFKIASAEEQENIFVRYGEFINSLKSCHLSLPITKIF